MPRFFKEDFEKSPVICGEDAVHITRALRMKLGEELMVCDTKGTDYRCKILSCDRNGVQLEIIEKTPSSSEPTVTVTLFQCLLKGDKFDNVIKHSVELGVSHIVPVLSKNCVARPDKSTFAKKTERWQKIVLEAAGQSGRGRVPTVCEPTEFTSCLEPLKNTSLSIFFYEAGGEPLTSIVEQNKASTDIAIVIGPEGGFQPEEVLAARQAGAQIATLGRRILRAETAPLAALTGIMLLSGNLE